MMMCAPSTPVLCTLLKIIVAWQVFDEVKSVTRMVCGELLLRDKI